MDLEQRRIALKLAYDGTKFFGFQRQPDRVTVEGEFVRALSKIGAISSSRECGYRSSSRTDRGVSALGNVVSLRTAFSPGAICSALNSEMEDIWAYAAAEVLETFNPRAATERWYRYYLGKQGQKLATMKKLAHSFVGVHDFSGYSRKTDRNPMRKIDSIEIGDVGDFFVLDFRAESFLWNMVRRIVWMVNEGSAGRMPLDMIGPEAARKPTRVGLAPPEYLVLMGIDCGVDLPVDRRAAIGIRREMQRRLRAHASAVEFSREFSALLGP